MGTRCPPQRRKVVRAMLVQRWTKDAILARMAAETAIDGATSVSDRDRAAARLDLVRVSAALEEGSLTSVDASSALDAIRRRLRARAA